MRIMRKGIARIAALFLLCGFACGAAPAEAASPGPGPVTKVKVETASLELVCNDPGKSEWAVVPSFEPEGGTYDELVIASDNLKVAEVVDGNVIKAVGPGNARVIVTARLEGARVSPQCAVKVRVVRRVTGIDLPGGPLDVTVKQSLHLKVKVEPADATDKKLKWKSSDETVATVSQNGTVRGLKAGEAAITVTAADGWGTENTVFVSVIQPVTAVKTLSGYHPEMTWDVAVNKPILISNAFAVQPANASNRELDYTVYLDGEVTEAGYEIRKNEAEGSTEITFTEPGAYIVEATSTDGTNKSAKIRLRIYLKDPAAAGDPCEGE